MGGSSSKKVACAPAEEGADAGDGAGAGDASAPAAGDEAGEEDDDDWEYDEGGGDETDAERSRRRYANAKASTKNVKEFCEKLGIRTTERSKLRALFDAHDKMHADGLVDIAEFCRGSEMDSLPFMHRVFDAMDTDEHLTAELAEGKLDYHEFLIGVYNFCALPGGDYLAKVCRDGWHTMTRAVSKEVLAEPLSGTVEFGGDCFAKLVVLASPLSATDCRTAAAPPSLAPTPLSCCSTCTTPTSRAGSARRSTARWARISCSIARRTRCWRAPTSTRTAASRSRSSATAAASAARRASRARTTARCATRPRYARARPRWRRAGGTSR
jgi:hypothetical protein